MPIEGIYAAAVTPRRRGLQDIDQGALWELIDFLCSKRLDGIVLMGATGEFVHFSVEERVRVLGLALKRSRIPVIVNVSHSTLDGALELTHAAELGGAAGLLLTPPYFYRYPELEISAFYEYFAREAKPQSPVLLYHLPAFTNSIGIGAIEHLIAEGVVAGVKDSSGDASHLQQLAALGGQYGATIMTGSDTAFGEGHALHVNGIVSGTACALPELMIACRRALDKGPSEVASRLLGRVAEFGEWLETFPVPVGIRSALQLRKVQSGAHALPLSAAAAERMCAFEAWFPAWWSEVQSEFPKG